MDQEYEERVRSILTGRNECDEKYSTIYEFKYDLKEVAFVEQELEAAFWHHSNHTS